MLSPRLDATDEELLAKWANLVTDHDVADLLEVPIAQLRYILYEGRGHYPYRKFTVPKRSGGLRTIEAPHPTFRILQRKLLRVLKLLAHGHPAAHGFAADRSIRTNAEGHKGKTHVFNLDLRNFFPSINFGRVQHIFMSHPFNVHYAAAAVLAQLCCEDTHLPQGAPTSPIISNMICFRLDGELRALAKKHKWFYTRYADDITLSTWSRAIPPEILVKVDEQVSVGQELRRIIESNWFDVNEGKAVFKAGANGG